MNLLKFALSEIGIFDDEFTIPGLFETVLLWQRDRMKECTTLISRKEILEGMFCTSHSYTHLTTSYIHPYLPGYFRYRESCGLENPGIDIQSWEGDYIKLRLALEGSLFSLQLIFPVALG